MGDSNATTSDLLLGMLRGRDLRFIDAVVAEHRGEILAPVASAWAIDRHAWARSEAERYFLRRGFSLGHEVVIKRLLHSAVSDRRDRTVAAALVFCDRLVKRKWGRQYDGARQAWVDRVRTRYDTLPKVPDVASRQRQVLLDRLERGMIVGRPFSYVTRYYLRRKVWRYFRETAAREPDAYVKAIGFALRQYTDGDTGTGIALMQCWSLLHICFGNHPGLGFTNRRAVITEGFRLQDVVGFSDPKSAPQPAFAELWKSDSASEQLRRVEQESRSSLIRQWARAVTRVRDPES